MVIQHNIPALNSHRNLGINNAATAKNLEKLSSGYRINRAGDDAAGLAISEKMRGQIRGLGMAEQNASHGINLIQTAEGGLNETHAILQRMRELAVQSSNATYQNEDRAQIEKEFQALKGEIDRIASSTHYNNIKVLDGTTGGQMLSYAQEIGINAASFADLGFDLANGSAGTLTVSATHLSDYSISSKDGTDIAAMGSGADIFKMLLGSSTASVSSNATTAAAAVITSIEFEYHATTGTWTAEITGANTNDFDSYTATMDANGNFVFTASSAGVLNPGTDDVTINFAALNNIDVSRFDTSNPITIEWTHSLTPANQVANTAGFDYNFELLDIKTNADAATFDVSVKWNGSGWQIDEITSADFDYMDLFTIDDTQWGAGIIKLVTQYGEEIEFKLDLTGFQAPDDGILSANFEVAVSGTTASVANVNETSTDVTSFTGVLVDPNVVLTDTQKLVSTMLASMGLSLNSAIQLDKLFQNNVQNPDYDNQDAYLQTRQVSDNPNHGYELVLQIGADSYVAVQDGNDVNFIRMVEQGTDTGTFLPETIATLTNVDLDAITTNGTISFNLRDGQAVAGIRGSYIATEAASSLQFQIGANGAADQRVGLFVANMSSMNIGLVDELGKTQYVYDLSVTTRDLANDAIDVLNGAIIQVAGQRAELGALQNRLEHTLNNLGVTKENLTAAESTIRDVDMAKEMMEFTKNNILVQAAQAMLAQANQLPQGVLSLLR